MNNIIKAELNCGEEFKINLPKNTDILSMTTPKILSTPKDEIYNSLKEPIYSLPLSKIIKNKVKKRAASKAVIVISDNTRPVPYKGEKGILLPIVEELIDNGVDKNNILILVATGTHRAVTESELRKMIDPKIFDMEIEIKNHKCKDKDNLVYLGKTSRDSEVFINKDYMESDIKILTGLVESHFMAGASGGRKSVCPGIIGEQSTYVFHGAKLLNSPDAKDLNLDENPVHEEALEVAKMAGVDFIVNVTLDHDFNLTGVFAGDLESAHKEAVNNIKSYVGISTDKEYDIVVAHAGFVGINHYQAAKVGVVSIPILKPDGRLIVVANNTDDDPIGSFNYKTTLYLLKKFGSEKFKKLILSTEWGFIPEQWQVQMWAKLFSKIPQKNMIYYSPQFKKEDYNIIPGIDGNKYLKKEDRYKNNIKFIPQFVEKTVKELNNNLNNQNLDIAYLEGGPYGVLIR